MMGKPQRLEGKLFYTNLNLEERMPQDHVLRRISEVIDFSFVRREVAHCYGYNGNESVDPTLLLKLLFLVFHERVRSERELFRQLPLRLDWLWFCRMDLDAEIPDHSVLSKARSLWGLETFERIFMHVLQQCVAAGLVDGETVYADSTVLKADASVDSRIPRVLWQQLEEASAEFLPADTSSKDDDTPEDRCDPPSPRPLPPEDTQAKELPPPPQGKFNARTVSRTDPDSATTSRRGKNVKLGYRDHSLVDGRCGIVLATIATAADYDDSALLTPLLDKQLKYLAGQPHRVVADSSYGTKHNIDELRSREIKPYLKRRPSKNDKRDWLDRMPEECDPATAIYLMKRRLHTAEGRFAEAHVLYEHRRCRWRRRWRVQIQCYLVAAVQNIGKLARYARQRRKPAEMVQSVVSSMCSAARALPHIALLHAKRKIGLGFTGRCRVIVA